MRQIGEYDMKKMSDSRMLYRRNPPRFAYIFITIVIVVILCLTAWSAVAVKAEEVEVSGIIVSEDKTTLTTQTDGTVAYVYFTEGDEIEEGDVVFSFDKTEIELQITTYSEKVDYYESRISYINTMIDAISDGTQKQPFENSGEQQEFYIMFQNYICTYNSYTDTTSKNQYAYQTQLDLISSRNTCDEELASATTYLETYENEVEKYDMTAESSGTLHYDTEITVGMVISSGTEIGSISGVDGEKTVEVYISASQRARVSVGEECYFTVDGLSQSEYGKVSATVESISSDSTLIDSVPYFKMILTFSEDTLTDSKGDTVQIVNGMTVSAWVIYDKTTYLEYFLDKIGIH